MNDMPHTPSSLEDVADLVKHQLHLLWALPEQASAVAPLMLWGPPGVGKSTVMRSVANELGIGFLDIRLAQREPVDLRGLPVPREESVEWLLSSEWPRDPNSRGIILFDELTAADRTLQVAAYELLLERRLGTLYKVPPGWYLAAAGNRAGDRAVAGTLSSALANRFCHLEVAVSVEDWVAWASQRGLPSIVPAFLRFRPGLFLHMEGSVERGWPSPRSWERVAVSLQHGGSLPMPLRQRLIEGLVGIGAAAEFLAFVELADSLPDVDSWLQGTGSLAVPERPDLRYALVGLIAERVWLAPRQRRAIALALEVSDALGSDFAALLLTDMLRGRSADQLGLVLQSPAFPGWLERHGTALRGRLTRRTDSFLGAVLGGPTAPRRGKG